MLSEFKKDLARGYAAEHLVKEIFADLTTDFEFIWVGDKEEYRDKGDIIARAANKEYYIEVKDDSCICTTGNVLCEEANYIYENDYSFKGNIYNECDVYCVLSQPERKLYLIDFKVLKNIYKKYGDFKIIKHAE